LAGKAVDDLDYTQDSTSFFSGLELKKPILPYWTPSLLLSYVYTNYKGDDPTTWYNNYETKSFRRKIEQQNEITPLDWYTGILGFEYEVEKAANKGNFDEDVSTKAIFLENQFKVVKDHLFFTAGGRYTDHSMFGNKTTFRLTSSYLVNFAPKLHTKFHTSFGTGFKAPSLNDLYFPFWGNKDLKPEESKGFDIGVEQGFFDRKVLVDVTYFYNRFTDLIAAGPMWQAENVKRAQAKGVEYNLSVSPIEEVSANIAYTFTDSEDKSTGKQLPRRPKHKGSILFDIKPIKNLSVVPSYTFAYKRTDDAKGTPADNYGKVDISTTYDVTKNFQFFGRIENLFDREYEEVRSYTSPGRSFFAGVKASF